MNCSVQFPETDFENRNLLLLFTAVTRYIWHVLSGQCQSRISVGSVEHGLCENKSRIGHVTLAWRQKC